jgi:hypothetical protein
MSFERSKIVVPIVLTVVLVGLGFVFVPSVKSQEVVDRIIATVSDRSLQPQIITYSDLVWHLALDPEAAIDPPVSEDLNRALQNLINLRLFALEAQRLPSAEPTDEEISGEIQRILASFSSPLQFEKRLRDVGFKSVMDDNFLRMMKSRVAIEKYVDFRFRSFVIVTPEEELKYYREVFTPDFRKRNPGLLLPQFDEVRLRIYQIITEDKIEEDIERFLDEAKSRAEIVVLAEV